MVLVLPALTDCRWWFESLLVHSGGSSATRRKATGADQKKKSVSPVTYHSVVAVRLPGPVPSDGQLWELCSFASVDIPEQRRGHNLYCGILITVQEAEDCLLFFEKVHWKSPENFDVDQCIQ